MDEPSIIWTDYMQHRLELRDFDRAVVERIVRYSAERYIDMATGRSVAIGRHDKRLVLVPYEHSGNTLTPVTVHATSRKQITFRVKMGRFRNE